MSISNLDASIFSAIVALAFKPPYTIRVPVLVVSYDLLDGSQTLSFSLSCFSATHQRAGESRTLRLDLTVVPLEIRQRSQCVRDSNVVTGTLVDIAAVEKLLIYFHRQPARTVRRAGEIVAELAA